MSARIPMPMPMPMPRPMPTRDITNPKNIKCKNNATNTTPAIYDCSLCNFSTSVKGSFKKHEATKRHMQRLSAHSASRPQDVPTPVVNTQSTQQQSQVPPSVEQSEKPRGKGYHLGALRLLQELSGGKITDADIAEYIKNNHPIVTETMSSDDESDADSDAESDCGMSIGSSKDKYNITYQIPGMSSEMAETTIKAMMSGRKPPAFSTTPVSTHDRHQPYYYDFPPEMPTGLLPDGPTYKMPVFVENRRKTLDSNDPDADAQQYNDIRQFIVDFLNGTQKRLDPDADKYRWQLNEITKLFIQNNIYASQNKPDFLGII